MAPVEVAIRRSATAVAKSTPGADRQQGDAIW
uniref:Uncharacterized protein n=1 Tax=Klebsiella pneumoniae CG43 TaxID=1244085 RepID=Q6U5K1_KLEPN|nr:hypothetical protein LV017 [Klebsiella pneumoniae CG43]UWM14662.1 hypothetical protein pA_gene0005 [Klebsiella pneumoniae]